MSQAVYGPSTRRQVVYRGEKIAGLFERTTSDGQLVYEVRRKVDGKSVRRALNATTATDAIREARAVVARIDSGAKIVSRTDVSLGVLRDEFEEWATGPASQIAESTAALYLSRLDQHVIRLLGSSTKAAAVTPAHLRAMIDKLRAERQSGSSVRGCVTAASALLKFGVRRGLVDTNPARLLERGDRPSAKRSSEPRYLDRAEIGRLLDELGDEFRPIAAVCAFAGLRISEALALRWRDVDLAVGMLNVLGTKTAASADTVPLIDDLTVELKAHRSRQAALGFGRVKPDALVFLTRTGQPQHRRNALRAVHAAGDRAKLNPEGVEKVGCHDLRHSCAGLLFAAGVSAPTIAAVLRHADVRITLTTYAGLVESGRAALRDDLEAAFGAGGTQ